MRQVSPFLRGGNLRQSLGTTLNELLGRIPPATLKAIQADVQAGALARGLYYESDSGERQATPILLRPRVLGGNQRHYLLEVCRLLERAYSKLFRMWHADPTVRRILPMTDLEQRWLKALYHPAQAEVFFGRFDASTDFSSPDWVRSTQFFEFNPVGAGGTYLAPTTDALVLQHVVPALRALAPTLLVERNDDPRKVLLEVLADHARSLGLRRFNVGLCQFKHLVGGVTEFPANAAYLRSRGIDCWHVDPSELRLVGDELRYGDVPIDILYRDHELSEFAAAEEAGWELSALKHAFRQGRVVSSLAGELDHKSAFQIFTSPEFSHHFSADARKLFRRHLPWTRIVGDLRTTDPNGVAIELLPWLRGARMQCVLKPNRGFGGEGILIGPQSTASAWDTALEAAVRAPDAWVVQAYHPVAEKDFPIIDAEGNLTLAEYFTVLGLFASTQRLGILGRASREKIVNVSRQGGLVAVLRLL